MKPQHFARLGLIFPLLTILASCAPQEGTAVAASPTQATPPDIVIASLEGSWPEPVPPEPCYIGLPTPEISLCLANQGGTAGSADVAYLTFPAALVPGGVEALLGTLPGGDWSEPSALSLANYPGSDLGAEGIVIINNNPAPDAAAAGIIVVDSLEGQGAIIVVDSIPEPGTLEGIVIIQHPAEQSQNVGLVTIHLVDSGVSSGEMSDVWWMEPLEDLQQMAEGIVWGGLVLGADSEFISSTPHAVPAYEESMDDVHDASIGAIVWGGMPEGADGIIVVDSLPASGEAAQGIIIVYTEGASQLMGIIVEGMPGDDSGQAGIVIVNTKPAEFLDPGLAWNAAIWPGHAQGDTGSEGIIIVNTMPVGVASLSGQMNFGFPEGLSLPEGMTPMMGDSPFGPQPILFGTLDLQQAFPTALEPGMEACMSFSPAALPVAPQAPGSGYPADSFFDVMYELTVAIPGSSEGIGLIQQSVQLPELSVAACTPTPRLPGEAGLPSATATPTPRVPPPTPTPPRRFATPTR